MLLCKWKIFKKWHLIYPLPSHDIQSHTFYVSQFRLHIFYDYSYFIHRRDYNTYTHTCSYLNILTIAVHIFDKKFQFHLAYGGFCDISFSEFEQWFSNRKLCHLDTHIHLYLRETKYIYSWFSTQHTFCGAAHRVMVFRGLNLTNHTASLLVFPIIQANICMLWRQ